MTKPSDGAIHPPASDLEPTLAERALGLLRPSSRRRERRILNVYGCVQGVGFRPFVLRNALLLHLRGTVWSESDKVVIDVEGTAPALDELVRRLHAEPPESAQVEVVESERAVPTCRKGFSIDASTIRRDGREGRLSRVAPDLAPCAACLAEVHDLETRRFGHAFACCSACGPRYSIARALPFDRERTTMAELTRCARCQAEYHDARSRRFHAQAVACPRCGPRLRSEPPSERPLLEAARVLAAGGIVAIEGTTGFHLACDAGNGDAVQALRRRKAAGTRPLAVMFRDLPAVEVEAEPGEEERRALSSPRAPLVLLARRERSHLAEGVAPGARRLGCSLPASMLHHLLFERFPGPLVMTAAPRASLPVHDARRAPRESLAGIAELVLLHDRPIANPCGDSVVDVVRGRERLLRLGRGYAPAAFGLGAVAPPLLAVGGDRASSLCVARCGDALVGQHLGDLADPAVRGLHAEARERMLTLFDVAPRLIVHDADPDLHATVLARELAGERGLALCAVQHHHALLAACLVEHARFEPVLGVVFDDGGYGEDGGIWGGELLVADLERATRLGRLSPAVVPGDPKSARRSWCPALAYLVAAGLERRVSVPASALARFVTPFERGAPACRVSSAGALFDAVAALCAPLDRDPWDRDAARALADGSSPGAEPYPLSVASEGELLELDVLALLRAVAADVERGVARSEIGSRFHAALAEGVGAACLALRERTGLSRVVLTGALFQNVLLLELVAARLEQHGFELLLPARTPTGDGALALGQAAVATWRSRAASR